MLFFILFIVINTFFIDISAHKENLFRDIKSKTFQPTKSTNVREEILKLKSLQKESSVLKIDFPANKGSFIAIGKQELFFFN